MPLGTIGDDGSGILMGQSVGGRTALMENVSAWRFVNPPQSFIRGILVDANGQRICNEMLYGAQLAQKIMDKAHGKAWLLLDSYSGTDRPCAKSDPAAPCGSNPPRRFYSCFLRAGKHRH